MLKNRAEVYAKYSSKNPVIGFRLSIDEVLLLQKLAINGESPSQTAARITREYLQSKSV